MDCIAMSDVQGFRGSKAKPLIIQPIWDRLDQAVIVTDRALAAPGPVIRYVNRAFTRLYGPTITVRMATIRMRMECRRRVGGRA
ncbi:hypothetical protein TSH7_26355 [Azospirillum sp. TSH7]|nr:hypothetical protein TSH7_26355 [Azospirillum sp. TSH7]PWC64892.1 hypothetical protein TSH20_17440 [Azospirillum sp. TSH20]